MSALSGARSRTVVALVAVLVLVVGLVGVGAVISSSDDPADPAVPDSSPQLSLSRTSNTGGGVAQDSAAALGTGPYELVGKLSGASQDGVVIDPGTSSVDEAQVRALLDALGMKQAAVKQVGDAGWTATGTAAGEKAAFALDQRVGNVWQYARGPLADCLAVQPGAAPDAAVSCAATAAPPSDDARRGPGRAAVLRDAADVFELVGITPGSGLRANDDGAGATYLDVPLSVEGLPVVDVTVSVGADAKGIVSASGWLDPTFTAVGRYPLISAEQGFVDLAGAPQPDIAAVCPTPATGEAPDTSCSDPRKVTAARLAWLTTQDAGRTVLVPAWQFEVDGFYGPAVVAVAPQFLSGPDATASDLPLATASSDPGSEPGSEPGSGSGSGSSDGVGSVEPGTAESAPAAKTD